LVKQGTEHELERIKTRNLELKTLFVVAEGKAEYAREVISRFWPEGKQPPPLYMYRASGELLDRETYHRDVARIISESHLWQLPAGPR